jgi:hypothetical protein
MGINRGPSMAYAALLADGWDVDAIAAIRSVREIAAVGYAEDALAWHHRRMGASLAQRSVDRQRLADWRTDNWIDVVRIIRNHPHRRGGRRRSSHDAARITRLVTGNGASPPEKQGGCWPDGGCERRTTKPRRQRTCRRRPLTRRRCRAWR